MIDMKELTPELKEKLNEYLERGLRIGLSTEPIDFEKAKALFIDLQTKLGNPVLTRVFYAESPKQAMEKVAEIRGSKEVWQSGFVEGGQELRWLYYYKFINDELPGINKVDLPLKEIIAFYENSGWSWAADDWAVIADRPVEYHSTKLYSVDSRLHNPVGPAIKFKDGYSVWALNGVLMYSELDTFKAVIRANNGTPVPDIARRILSVRNVEQRAELIKLYGIDKLFWDLKPRKLDADEIDGHPYELYAVKVYEDIARIYIKMQNPSVDEVHIEAVHPDCKTVKEALAWRNTGIVTNNFVSPMVLT